MSDDYISRSWLLKNTNTGMGVIELMQAIIDAPSADVHPVVRGKWIIHKPFDSGRHNCNECIECSVCGTWFGHDCYEISNFCPSCGADMRGEQDG